MIFKSIIRIFKHLYNLQKIKQTVNLSLILMFKDKTPITLIAIIQVQEIPTLIFLTKTILSRGPLFKILTPNTHISNKKAKPAFKI